MQKYLLIAIMLTGCTEYCVEYEWQADYKDIGVTDYIEGLVNHNADFELDLEYKVLDNEEVQEIDKGTIHSYKLDSISYKNRWIPSEFFKD